MNNDALLDMLKQTGQAIPVPGKPGRVYVYSKKRDAVIETTPKRARAWAAIAAAGTAARETLSRSAEQAYGAHHQIPAKENPMSWHDDDDDHYFRQQYSKAPFGAVRSLPAARRNPGEVLFTKNGQPYVVEIVNGRKRARFLKKSAVARMNGLAMTNPRKKKAKAPRKGNAMAGAAARRAQQIMAAQGCSLGAAMRQAWSEVRGAQAAANPQRSELPHGFWRKFGARTSNEFLHHGSAVYGPDAQPDYEVDDEPFKPLRRGPFAYRTGQFSTSETAGFQPVNRRNPKKKKR